MISTVGVNERIASIHEAGSDLNPMAALHVQQIPVIIAKNLIEKHHYLHTIPAGTQLAFGVFLNKTLLGAITFGVGPFQAYRLVDIATRKDCITLTRLWLDDRLPKNSASYVIGYVIRSLRQHTNLIFLVTYADPAFGHVGTIYQATGWLYTGLSKSSSLYDMGDGIPHHSRTLGSIHGTRSVKYLKSKGINVNLIKQPDKHRYVYFLDRSYENKLRVPVLPYPKKEVTYGNS